MHVISPIWADENQLKCEKVCFLSEMHETNSRWVIFNLWDWTYFKIEFLYFIAKFSNYLKIILLMVSYVKQNKTDAYNISSVRCDHYSKWRTYCIGKMEIFMHCALSDLLLWIILNYLKGNETYVCFRVLLYHGHYWKSRVAAFIVLLRNMEN